MRYLLHIRFFLQLRLKTYYSTYLARLSVFQLEKCEVMLCLKYSFLSHIFYISKQIRFSKTAMHKDVFISKNRFAKQLIYELHLLCAHVCKENTLRIIIGLSLFVASVIVAVDVATTIAVRL